MDYKILKNKKIIHLAFEVGIWLKGFDSVVQLVGGVLLLFVSPAKISELLLLISQDELSEDPHDFIAQSLTHLAHTFSLSSELFAAIYLLVHGAVKLCLVVALQKRKMWAYPSAIAVFALFIFYQLYRYANTHALSMLLLTLLDVVVVILTWLEYKQLKEKMFVTTDAV